MYDPIKDRVRKEIKAILKELADKRRRRLARVIAERYGGVQASLARALGMPRADLGNLLREWRDISVCYARVIEEKIGLPSGWLDSDDPHLPRNLRPDPKPVGKHTGRPSKVIAKLYADELEKRETKRPQRVAA